MNVLFGKDEKQGSENQQGYRPRSRQNITPGQQSESKDGVLQAVNFNVKSDVVSQGNVKQGAKQVKQQGIHQSQSSTAGKDDSSLQKSKGSRQLSGTGIPEGQTVSQLSIMQSLTSQEMLTSYYTQEMTLMNSRIQYLQQKLNKANEQAAEQQDVFQGQLSQWNAFYKEKQDSLHRQLSELEEELGLVRREKAQLAQLKADKEAEFSAYRGKVEELQKNYEHYNENMRTSREQIRSLEQQNKALSAQLIIQNDQIKQLQTERESFLAKINQYKDMENMLQRRIHKQIQTIAAEHVENGTITDSIDRCFKACQTDVDPLYEFDETTDAEVQKIIEGVYKDGESTVQKIEKQLNQCDQQAAREQEEHLTTTRLLEETQLREKRYQELAAQQLELNDRCATHFQALQAQQAKFQAELKRAGRVSIATEKQKPQVLSNGRQHGRNNALGSDRTFAAVADGHAGSEDVSYSESENSESLKNIQNTSNTQKIPNTTVIKKQVKKRPQPQYHQKNVLEGSSTEINEILNAMSQVSGMFQGEQPRLLHVKIDPQFQKLDSLNSELIKETLTETIEKPVQIQEETQQINQNIQKIKKNEQDKQKQENQNNYSEITLTAQKVQQSNSKKHNQLKDKQIIQISSPQKHEQKHNIIRSPKGALYESAPTLISSQQDTKQHTLNEHVISSNIEKQKTEPPNSGAWTTEHLKTEIKIQVQKQPVSDVKNNALQQLTEIDKHISDDSKPYDNSSSEDTQENEYSQGFKTKMEKIITKLLETGYIDDKLSAKELKYMKERGYELDDSESDVSLEKNTDNYSAGFKKKADELLNKIMTGGEMQDLTDQQLQYLDKKLGK